MPTGKAHQFSYQPFGPEQLSPRSTSSSEYESDGTDEEEEEDDASSSEDEAPMYRRPPVVRAAPPPPRRDMSDSDDEEDEEEEEEEESDDEDEEIRNASSDEDESVPDKDVQMSSDSEQHSPPQAGRRPTSPFISPRHTFRVVESASIEVICTFTLEELAAHASDGGREILHPAEIESLASASRASSRASMLRRELPIRILSDLRNLNCSQEVSSDEEAMPPSPGAAADLENEAFYKWQAERRRRRVSMSSSIGKRTHSELSEDSDIEEDGGLDVNDVGFSARKMRKRQHRGSLLFQDPPEPRIDELEEPSSGEDEREANQALSRELPYARMEIIDMDDL